MFCHGGCCVHHLLPGGRRRAVGHALFGGLGAPAVPEHRQLPHQAPRPCPAPSPRRLPHTSARHQAQVRAGSSLRQLAPPRPCSLSGPRPALSEEPCAVLHREQGVLVHVSSRLPRLPALPASACGRASRAADASRHACLRTPVFMNTRVYRHVKLREEKAWLRSRCMAEPRRPASIWAGPSLRGTVCCTVSNWGAVGPGTCDLQPLGKGGDSTESRGERMGRVRGKGTTHWTRRQHRRQRRFWAEGHPPPARPPPARCEAVGTSVGVWNPTRGSPRSLGGEWRRCGSSGRSCPCGEPACYPGLCTSAHASGCWTARSGSLRGTGARLSVPGTRRGEKPAGNVHGQSPRTPSNANHCAGRASLSMAPHETAHVGSPGGRAAERVARTGHQTVKAPWDLEVAGGWGRPLGPRLLTARRKRGPGGRLHPAEGTESWKRFQVHLSSREGHI